MLDLRKNSLISLGVLVLLIGALACTDNNQTAQFEVPEFYSDDAINQTREYVSQGYNLLDSGLVDSAIAEFARISAVVDCGLVREYHTACAYGRTGDKDRAFNWLNQLVANGYDSPEQLRGDGDFSSLVDDPRFDQLVEKARQNSTGFEAALVSGMPEYGAAPQKFTTEEEFDSWVEEQTRRIRSHRIVWTPASHTLAKIDLAAQKLACLRELKADDPEFDYGLERVREATNVYSMYEPWGAASDLAIKEAENYMGSSSSDVDRSEANYRAGLALSMRYTGDDSLRVGAYEQAKTYLAQVTDGTDYYGAAQAFILVNQLRTPGADKETLAPELRGIVEQFGEDQNTRRVISTQYGNDAVGMLWPLGLDLPDIDQKQVTLDEYRGKALLIDFWAIWCRPCRAELPGMLEVYEEYHPKGLEIVSISLDYSDDTPLQDYRNWIGEKDMSWRHVYDGEGWNTELVKRYYVSSIPAPFLVGPDGSLAAYGEDLRGDNLATSVERAISMIGN